LKVGWLKVGIVLKYLLLGCASGEPSQHIPDGDAQTADAGLAGALAGLDGDAGLDGAGLGEMIARFGNRR